MRRSARRTGRGAALTVTIAVLATAGCAAQRPVVYPGASASIDPESAIEQCINEAEAAGLDYREGGEVAESTVAGATVGGASGAAGGAVFGRAGRGAAAGAAAGASRGFFRGLFRAREPHGIYRRYVDTCLQEHGHRPIGWQ